MNNEVRDNTHKVNEDHGSESAEEGHLDLLRESSLLASVALVARWDLVYLDGCAVGHLSLQPEHLRDLFSREHFLLKEHTPHT